MLAQTLVLAATCSTPPSAVPLGEVAQPAKAGISRAPASTAAGRRRTNRLRAGG
jgi:hypothetical protein